MENEWTIIEFLALFFGMFVIGYISARVSVNDTTKKESEEKGKECKSK